MEELFLIRGPKAKGKISRAKTVSHKDIERAYADGDEDEKERIEEFGPHNAYLIEQAEVAA